MYRTAYIFVINHHIGVGKWHIIERWCRALGRTIRRKDVKIRQAKIWLTSKARINRSLSSHNIHVKLWRRIRWIKVL